MSGAPNTAWETVPGGVRLHVRLTPRGGRDAVDGLRADAAGRAHLAVRVSAPPEKGAANKALGKLIAKVLGVPAGAVTLAAGATARVKTLEIEGDAGELAVRLEALAGNARPR